MAPSDPVTAVGEAGQPTPQTGASTRAGITGRPASRRGKKGVLIYVEPDMARALKRMALEHDTTLQALGYAALATLLRTG